MLARWRPVDATLTDVEPPEQLTFPPYFDLEVLLSDPHRARDEAFYLMNAAPAYGALFSTALGGPPRKNPRR